MPRSEACSLAALPEDERRHVCALLEPTDILNLGQVCRSLRPAGSDEVVWEQFCRDRWFSPHSVPGQTWKDTYGSNNGWNRCLLAGSVIAPSRLSVGARWSFEWHSASMSALLSLLQQNHIAIDTHFNHVSLPG